MKINIIIIILKEIEMIKIGEINWGSEQKEVFENEKKDLFLKFADSDDFGIYEEDFFKVKESWLKEKGFQRGIIQ